MVSVIIVSWNARDHLLQCLESLSPEVCRHPLEIIVVDNASSDGSPECVESRFPNVRLIRNAANLGFARANNAGISRSSGRYLCLVNSDVRVLPECINRLVDYCEAHGETGMAGSAHCRFGRTSATGLPAIPECMEPVLQGGGPRHNLSADETVWRRFAFRPATEPAGCGGRGHTQRVFLAGPPPGTGGRWFARRSFFMYGEDMDWCRRFREQGWKRVFVPAAQAVHFGAASSANAPIRFYIERSGPTCSIGKNTIPASPSDALFCSRVCT